MATANLPLHCSICPKKPDFSDVSHLLTHIASKGHLSHYYKMKVRAANDNISRELIHTYDQWYSNWNVEGLMSERLNLKDRKRPKAQASVVRPQKKSARRKEQNVDPRLSGISLKHPNVAPATIPASPRMSTPSLMIASPFVPQQRIYRARLHLWSTRRPTCVDAIPLEFSSPITSSPPTFLSHCPQQAPLAQMFSRIEMEVDIGEDEEEESGTAATKLKGVLWPGMNIFDAATPDMKRRRNQKKEISVVERLERNSFAVEANEMIFTPAGSLWKQRPISGQVDFDSSPYKVAHPSPIPKRKSSSRVPLTERDKNSLMLPPQLTSTSRRTLDYGPVKNSGANVDADQKPTKKKRRNFSVLDERGQDAAKEPTDMRYLTAELHQGQLPGYEPAQRQQRVLEGPMGALYQPAFQHNYFTESFETYHTPMYAMPYYGYYGHTNYDMPGFFSYPTPLLLQQELENDKVLDDNPDDNQFDDDKSIADETHTVSTHSDE